MRRLVVLFTCALLGVVVAGCQSGPARGVAEGWRETADGSLVLEFTVLSANGTPLPFAAVELRGGGRTLAILSSDEAGAVGPTPASASIDEIVVSAPLHAAARSAPAKLPAVLQLQEGDSSGAVALRFLARVDIACPTDALAHPGALVDTPCSQQGEPVLEVASDGTIWVSATNYPGNPPIWRSRDGGTSFEYVALTPAGALREACCTEGDFAFDDAGNLYFTDMAPFSFGVNTVWGPDGEHRWTVPGPQQRHIDRPWTRAGVADTVHVIYNAVPTNVTGFAEGGYFADSYFMSSHDGALTWSPMPTVFPCALGNLGQGPSRERLFVTACVSAGWQSAYHDTPLLWLSEDGGVTWSAEEKVPMPDVPGLDWADSWVYPWLPSVADAAGNIYVAFTHATNAEGTEVGVWLARRDVQGGWHGPYLVGSSDGNALYPWPAASQDGVVAVAWMHSPTPNTDDGDADAVWHTMAAASVDASSETPHFQVVVADPEPTHLGAVRGERAGSPTFLQADFTPDGRLAIAYESPYEAPMFLALHTRFVQSDATLDLGPRLPLYGPVVTPGRP